MKVLHVEQTEDHDSYPNGCDRQRAWPKLRGQKAAMGGRASAQAATRVNLEQASKVNSRTPTRLSNGEGQGRAEDPSQATRVVRRGSESGMRTRSDGQRGRSARVRANSSQLFARKWRARKSEGLVVPPKPVNTGGGKEPCLWDAFEVDPEGRLA